MKFCFFICNILKSQVKQYKDLFLLDIENIACKAKTKLRPKTKKRIKITYFLDWKLQTK